MEEYLHMKYNRPEVLKLEDDHEERKVMEAKKAMKEYAIQIEIREIINRKVMKLRTDLIYGPEKKNAPGYENPQLDFNYFDNIVV